MPDWVKLSFVIFDIPGTLTLRTERQCTDVKNYKDDLTGCFCSCTHYPYGNSGRQRVKRLLYFIVNVKWSEMADVRAMQSGIWNVLVSCRVCAGDGATATRVGCSQVLHSLRASRHVAFH